MIGDASYAGYTIDTNKLISCFPFVVILEWFHSTFHPSLFVFRRFQLSQESNHPRLKNVSKLGEVSDKRCKASFESVKDSYSDL